MSKLESCIKKIIYLLNRPQKLLCMLVLLLTLIGSVLECLGVSIIIPVMNLLMEPEQFLNNHWIKNITFLQQLDHNGLVVFVMGSVIIVYLLKNVYFIMD